MAHNSPTPQQGPQEHDPAGSTQMFQAFVNDDATARRAAPVAASSARASSPRSSARASSGSRVGLVTGVVLAVVALAALAWLTLG